MVHSKNGNMDNSDSLLPSCCGNMPVGMRLAATHENLLVAGCDAVVPSILNGTSMYLSNTCAFLVHHNAW